MEAGEGALLWICEIQGGRTNLGGGCLCPAGPSGFPGADGAKLSPAIARDGPGETCPKGDGGPGNGAGRGVVFGEAQEDGPGAQSLLLLGGEGTGAERHLPGPKIEALPARGGLLHQERREDCQRKGSEVRGMKTEKLIILWTSPVGPLAVCLLLCFPLSLNGLI